MIFIDEGMISRANAPVRRYETICVASVSQFITRASLPDNQYSLRSAGRRARRAEASGGRNEEIMEANGGKTKEKRTNDPRTWDNKT